MEDETRSTSSLSDIAISIIDEGPLSPLRQRSERSVVSHIKRNLQSSGKPLILLESAGKASCCIFRIPDSLAEVNPKAYKPKVVSIGPYHYGENHLQMIQQHKFRFLELFVDRATKKGMDENVLYAAVGALQHKRSHIFIAYSPDGVVTTAATTTPLAPSCQSWCPRDSEPWAEKCGWRKCADCRQCSKFCTQKQTMSM